MVGASNLSFSSNALTVGAVDNQGSLVLSDGGASGDGEHKVTLQTDTTSNLTNNVTITLPTESGIVGINKWFNGINDLTDGTNSNGNLL